MARRMSERRRSRLLWELAKGHRDVLDLAAEFKLSLHDLVYWVELPENRQAMLAMSRLQQAQTRIVLDRTGLHAAWRLSHLATREDVRKEHEVSRRACLDVLKTQLHDEAQQAASNDEELVDAAQIVREIEAAQREVLGGGDEPPH